MGSGRVGSDVAQTAVQGQEETSLAGSSCKHYPILTQQALHRPRCPRRAPGCAATQRLRQAGSRPASASRHESTAGYSSRASSAAGGRSPNPVHGDTGILGQDLSFRHTVSQSVQHDTYHHTGAPDHGLPMADLRIANDQVSLIHCHQRLRDAGRCARSRGYAPLIATLDTPARSGPQGPGIGAAQRGSSLANPGVGVRRSSGQFAR